MELAIWIIAIVEVVRAIQNFVPVILSIREKNMRKNAYGEFVASLKKSDKEFVMDLLEEFEKWEEE